MKNAEIYFVGNNLFESQFKQATLTQVKDFIVSSKEIGLDIETSRKYPKGIYREDIYKPGLDPYVTNICMVQIGNLDIVYIIDVRNYSVEILKDTFAYLNWNDSITIVGHNLKFEGKHFLHNYNIRFKKVWDTMLCEINLTNGLHLGYGLADLATRYLNAVKSEEISLFSNYNTNEYEDYNEFIFEQEDRHIIDKSTRLGFIEIGDKPFTENQIKYGVDDIVMPLLIKEKQLENPYNPTICHHLENRFSQVLAKLELKGMHFDSKKWLDVYNDNLPIYISLKNKLDNFVIQKVPKFTGTLDLFSPEKGSCTIKWSSSKQVIDLFKHLGFCPKEKSKQTKRLEYTVGDKALFKLLDKTHKTYYYKKQSPDIVDNQTLIINYLLYKKYEQACTTFGKDWLKYVHPITKRVHSSYRQILNTGRMSSTNPNLQNIPSDSRYRKCFTSPKNYKIVNADYAAQEIRVLAQVSNVKDMQDFFIHGNEIFGSDFHSFTADKMFKIIYQNPDFHVPPKELEDGTDNPLFNHKKERDAAKAINFKINYGGSAFTLKDDFGVTEEEAQLFIDNYMKAFPGLQEDFDKVKKEAVKNGYIVIDRFTNRRWFDSSFKEMINIQQEVNSLYPSDWSSYSKEEKDDWKQENKYITSPLWKKFFTLKSKLERNALNYRIQGLSGGMTKLACIFIDNELEENNISYAYLNNIIHDETNSECIDDKDKLDFYSKLVEDSMVKAGTYFCKDIPMAATAVIGDYWSH